MTTIRPLTAADRPDWEELWRDYLAFYNTSRDASIYDLTFSRILDPAIDMHGRIARIDGAAVGIVHFLYHLSFWDAEPRVYLNDLFVLPKVRGKGVGEDLIQEVYEHGKARNTPRIYWLTAIDNAPARALYDRVAKETPFIKYEGPVTS